MTPELFQGVILGSYHSSVSKPTVSFFFLTLIWRYVYWSERKRKGERNIDVRKKHQSLASHTRPVWGSNLQPRYVPWPGIEPSTIHCTRWCSNQLSHPPRVDSYIWQQKHTQKKKQTYFIKTENFCASNDTIKRVKSQSIEWEKISAKSYIW